MSSSPSAALVAPSFEGDFSPGEAFSLEAGGVLQSPTLRYAIYGEPNAAADNVIFVAHALSGSARVADWWPRLFSDGGLLQAGDHCVIGMNMLGSCYGSTGPGSIDPLTGRPYGPNFPLVSIRDVVTLQARLLDKLKIHRLKLVMGASDRRHAGAGDGDPISRTGGASDFDWGGAPAGDGPGLEPPAAADDRARPGVEGRALLAR